MFRYNDELDRSFTVDDKSRKEAWSLMCELCSEEVHFWGRHWRRLTAAGKIDYHFPPYTSYNSGCYPDRTDLLIRDASLFVACQPETVSSIWERHLQYLSDTRHRDIVSECTFPSAGVNIFRETRETKEHHKRAHRTDAQGNIIKWVESRPVTHYARRQGEKTPRPLPTHDVFYDKHGQKRKRRINHGHLPIICSRNHRDTVLHMKTSRVSLTYAGTIFNQFHNWCQSGALVLIGDKRYELNHKMDWKELSLAWLSIVVEPKKPR